MRTHDWSRSLLGPAAAWPQPLKTLVGVMLAASQPMFVAWGPERILLYNDAYAALMADRHPAALGRPFFDVWHDILDECVPLFEQVFAGEPVHMDDIELRPDRPGRPREAHFAFSYTPVRDAGGEVAGLFCVCSETTDQVFAERRRDTLFALEDRLCDVVNPAELSYRACELLGEALSATRVGYGVLDADAHTVAVEQNWRQPGFADVAGLHSFADYGAHVENLLRGEVVMNADVERDARTAANVAAFHALGIRAHLDVAVVENGRAVAEMFVHADAPRVWTADEVALVREAAERTRAAIARRQAEAELRRSEARHRFRVELGDTLNELSAPAAIMAAVAERLGPFLGVDQANYYLIERDRFIVVDEWRTANSAGMVGDHALGDFGQEVNATLAAGRPLRVDDTGKVEAAETFAAVGMAAVLSVPLNRNGRWAAGLHVHQATPRAWTDDELALLREVGAQTWAAIERARAEAELRGLNDTLEAQVAERTAELGRVWRLSQDVIVIIDFAGTFRAINPAFTRVLGWTENEVIGRPMFEFVHLDDQLPTGGALEHAAGCELPAFENRYRHKDGGWRWLSWVAAPEGALIYATARHVTAEKDAAAELAATQDALRQSQKMEAVGQLTGGLAHDFNNLLAGISGSLELIRMRLAQGRTAEVEKYATAAQGAANRAAALTHRLLAFSRRQTLAPKPTDVKQLVSGMADLIARTTGPQVSLELVNAVGLWPSLIDPSQLENAVLNLCINARDAMPDGGTITIETANRWMDRRTAQERGLEPGQYISLCVSDTGTGMPPEVIAKAFDPFFTTKPIGVGTGLGLSMIYGFAKQSGGAVHIYSEPGKGTNVCIYLPRFIGETDAADAPADIADAPRGEGETVLVVDDEPTVRMLVAEVLGDLGYTAIEAEDGASGLKVLNSPARVDLLVTDVGLPGGMNGRQVADAARMVRPDLKVLFITGYAENAVLSHGHLDPGMHVMTKPFAIDALAGRIRELITG